MKVAEFKVTACGQTISVPSFELSDTELLKVVQAMAGRKAQESIIRTEDGVTKDKDGNEKKKFKYEAPTGAEIVALLKGTSTRSTISDDELVTFFVGKGVAEDKVRKGLVDPDKRKKAVAIFRAANKEIF